MKVTEAQIVSFRKKIRTFYRSYGRDLPFRMIDDPYAVTVSELMLQQTQVDRVLPKYISWLNKYPTWQKLSEASNKSILSSWSGLGYNRRALYLKKIATEVSKKYNGKLPTDLKLLLELPGIGSYTAHAILIFAFQKRYAAVDTNIRKVLLSSFNLSSETSISETQKLAELVLPQAKIREWHYALMDYAKTLPNEIHDKYRSKYGQSKFEGSIRQIRGEIIRQLTTKKNITSLEIMKKMSRSEEDILKAIESLQKEKIIQINKNKIKLIDS